jgi:hypothetical protein
MTTPSGTIAIANNAGNYYISNGSSTSTTSSTSTWATTSSTSGLTITGNTNGVVVVNNAISGDIDVSPNSRLKLPDGHVIVVDDVGNFEILDDDAQVTYQGNNVLEFNKYINASDLLEAFIKDLGGLGVKQGEVLDVPINLFINWLILNAADQDGDDTPDDVPRLEASVKPTKHPKCLCCGKFISKTLVEHKIHFCSPHHHERYLAKVGI